MTQQTSKPPLWQRSKRYLFPTLLLYWLFCLPLAVAIYLPWSYQANCHWNERCERMGLGLTEKSIQQLNGFFLHQSDKLERPWTNKEFRHLDEVRGIYDGVFIGFVLVTLLFVLDLLKNRQLGRYHDYAFTSLNIVLGLLMAMIAISPFFNYFWMELFHPLLFNNQLWRTGPQDVSWYLMPKAFFLRVILFLLATTVLLNLLLLWVLPKPERKPPPQLDRFVSRLRNAAGRFRYFTGLPPKK